MEKYKQLLECFKDNNSSEVIKELDEDGILEKVLPVTKEMKQVGKCKYHVVDVFQHSIFTLKKFEEILKQDNFLKEHLKDYVLDYLNLKDEYGISVLEVLKLGVFIHDIGKPSAKTVDSTGRPHFREHAITGGQIAIDLAEKLNLSDTLKDRLFKYVRYHMTLLVLYKTNDLSKENLWGIYDVLGDDIIGVMLLGYCDLTATRELLDPDEHNEITKTYMEFILTSYLYRYKTDKKV